MTSYTFTLTGNSHELSTSIHPAIDLDPNSNYVLALIGFHTFNSIPNIEEGNNLFFYMDKSGKENGIIIPSGSYEIEDLEKFIQDFLLNEHKDLSENDANLVFSLKPNNNTLKCEIKSEYFDIDFRPNDSIGRMLGFSHRYLNHGYQYESDITVDIIKVTTININCNLVVNCSYDQGQPTHTLYSFSPSVNPGYAINIEPHNLIYLPVRERRIENISISIVDQRSRPVNLKGETVTVRLELKKVN